MAETFLIVPARSSAFFLFMGLFIGGLILLFGYIGYSSRFTRFEVSDRGLTIAGTLYGRTIPWEEIDREGTRVLDLGDSPEYRPTIRTNGVGLPGYQAGWFRLRGAGRGLLFVTDRERLVVVPTRLGYSVLLSPREPEALVEALRRGG